MNRRRRESDRGNGTSNAPAAREVDPGKRSRTARLPAARPAAPRTNDLDAATSLQPDATPWCDDDPFAFGAASASDGESPDQHDGSDNGADRRIDASADAGAGALARLDRVLAAIGPLDPLSLALRVVGWRVTGAAIGGRIATSAAGGLGASKTTDLMVLVDPETRQIVSDAFPAPQIGLHAQFGPSAGIVLALRVGPAGPSADLSASYEGSSASLSPKAFAGWGLGVSTALLAGQEGWVTINYGVGADVGLITVSKSASTRLVLEAAGALAGEAAHLTHRLVAWAKGGSDAAAPAPAPMCPVPR